MKMPVRLDLLARVMAAENISVVYDPEADTAMFDVQDRILTVPAWQNISRNIHILFIAHEVSHALNTPMSLFDDIKKAYGEDRFDHNLLNIVEDVRIERLIVMQYPKLTPFFQDGYTDLIGMGFWNIPEDIRELKTPYELRINTQAKLRKLIEVQFTDEEQEVYDFLQTMITTEDCVVGYGKVLELLEKDPDYIERRELQKKLMEGLSSLAEMMKEGKVTKADIEALGSGGDVVSEAIDKIAEEMKEKGTSSGQSTYNKSRAKFHPNFTPKPSPMNRTHEDKKVVSNIVTEFQRRKRANVMRKTREHLRGDIAEKKLHQYAYSENIFRTHKIEPVGKNHGISFLIDISGSMEGVIQTVFRRVVMLTDFCDRVRIPYTVMAFTSSDWNSSDVYALYDSMKGKNFRELAINSLLSRKFPLRMGGTPLSESMRLYAEKVKEFRDGLSIDLMTSILLTDGGEGHSPTMTNYYGEDFFVETKTMVTLAEIMNKHLRDVGINTIHHHIGNDTYPFNSVTWNERNKSSGMAYSKPDEIFDMRIHERKMNSKSDARIYSMMIADIINNRIR